jgi:hypothetical protein
MKDEALKIALDALKLAASELYRASSYIELARALDKKAENARGLGLDYEPAQKQRWAVFCRFCNKEWSVSYKHPGKSVCVDCDDAPPAQPAPVQERTDYAVHLNHCNIGECEGVCKYLDDDCPALKHADMKAKWDKTTPPAAQPAPVQDLPFGVGGGLVAIKTLLSRDPCVHANKAIEMIDAILKEHTAAPVQPVALPTDAQIAATAGRIGGFSDEAALGKQWDDVYLLVRRVITERTAATPPTQPAPVPLTDEQIESLLPDDDKPMSLGEAFVKFARLVEAHHGITKGQP